MKNSIKKVVARIGKKIFVNAAFSTHDSACAFGFYQPKEPKCIKNK